MTKKKKIVRLAVIRSDNVIPCPFGLTVPYACKTVGELIHKMGPINILGPDSSKDEIAEIAEANNHLLRWKSTGQRCPYAGKLFPDKDVVECNWESNAPGAQSGGSLMGSPFFYKHFSGTGLDGLYSYPMGYYTDNSIDRGLYYGMYSVESTGTQQIEEITKDSNEKKTKK